MGVRRVDVEHLGLVVGGAERARDIAVEQLPVGLLGIAEPQRILALRGGAGQQAGGNLGAGRELQAHLVLLIGLLGRQAAAGRIGLLVDLVANDHGDRHGAVAAEVEGAAVRAGLQLEVARHLGVARIAAAAVVG